MSENGSGFKVTSSWRPDPAVTSGATTVKRAQGRDHSEALIAVLGGSLAVNFILSWVPELLEWSVARWVYDQLDPLVSAPLVQLSLPGVTEVDAWIQAGALVATLVLSLSRRWDVLRSFPVIAGAGVVIGLGCVVGLFRALDSDDPWAPLALLAAVAVLAFQTCRWCLSDTGTRTSYSDGFLVAPIVGGATFLPALALGRALEGGEMVPLARSWGSAVTIGTISTLWFWLLGIVAIAGVAAAVALANGTKQRGTPLVVVAAALVMVLGPLGAKAAEADGESYQSLQVRPESGYCQIWWRNRTPEPSITFSGRFCAKVTVREGKRPVAEKDVSFNLSDSAWRGPNGVDPDESVHSAMYGDTVVVTAQETDGAERYGILAFDFRTGNVKWFRACGSAAYDVGARFAGSGADKSGTYRKTRSGEGAAIFLRCQGRTLVIDPASGRIR